MVGDTFDPGGQDREEAAGSASGPVRTGGFGDFGSDQALIRRIAVIGGAGAFGRSLVRGLLETTDCDVVICGRSRERAAFFAATLGERASVAVVDRSWVDAGTLKSLGVFCVVDAAGPFQGGSMDFARAVTGAGCHYVDLADARDFVARLPELDLLARQHNVVALCGASSTPALSMAVVAALSEGWRRVDSVESIILPGGSAQMGLSVVQAILSYAGKPVRLLRHGRWGTAPGWGLMRREVIPGLGGWFVSLVETPDLDLVPEVYPSVRHAGFFAGVELSLMHLGLWVLSLPVRWGVVSSLRGLAPLLHPVANWLGRFGGERGGMIVRVSGADASGAPVEAQWSLIADAGDGPNIPALPALCAVHALLRGEVIPGARACVGKLGEIETQFRRFAIRTERQVTALEKLPLFARTSDGFAQMPLAVRAAHCPDPAGEFEGEVDVMSGENFLARFVARIAGFPVRNDKCQARVTIERRGNDEVWIRRFGRHQFQSTLSAGELPHHVHERFGPITICMWLETSASGFSLSILGWSIWGVPLPRALAPTTRAGASSDSEGRYRFDTLISWPPVGRLVHYRGWLVPVTVAR